MTSDSTIEAAMAPMTAMASGCNIWEPAPRPRARGIMPATVASAVITIVDPESNSQIGDTPPEDYLEGYTGIFEQHMIPDKPRLWRFESFEEFLEKRLKLMCDTLMECSRS